MIITELANEPKVKTNCMSCAFATFHSGCAPDDPPCYTCACTGKVVDHDTPACDDLAILPDDDGIRVSDVRI